MTETYDLSTSIGQVRLLCLDREDPYLFSDEEIQVYLTLEDNDTRLAAALALENIAHSKTLLDKVRKVGEIELVPGVDIAKQLMQRAEMLRSTVYGGSYFAVADISEAEE